MKPLNRYAIGVLIGAMGAVNAMAGQAATRAAASSGRGGKAGTAAATADYQGHGNGPSLTKTQAITGDVNFARGVAVGADQDGIDLSFSHAIAGRLGLAYAGTLNISIGHDGKVSTSYGGVLSEGGKARSVEAAGSASSDRHGGGSAQASATGHTAGGGEVKAYTQSNTIGGPCPVIYRSGPAHRYVAVRSDHWRR
ncbi:MAG TPA: hypothetical protein PKY77_21555 [Phycisphaerae bacterium]|nr:hypothetical protein [Phycisphaerae bacterium]HRY66764.1 hypothetical protein [Phycisphaerae bacterium]HSA28404.1 hypothetical protein [Phycisphaerae bacterium]